MALRFALRSQRGTGDGAREVVECPGRDVPARRGLALEDFRANGEEGEYATGCRKSGAEQHRSAKAVIHRGWVVERRPGQPGDQGEDGDDDQSGETRDSGVDS